MKKISTFALVPILLFSFSGWFSKIENSQKHIKEFFGKSKNDSSCLSNQPLIDYISATDSLSGYFNFVKTQLSEANFNLFKESMRLDDPQNAFIYCGTNASSFENKYILVHNNLFYAWNALVRSIDPDSLLSNQELSEEIGKLIDCFFSDENNPVIRIDPCEADWKICMRSAKREYNRDARDCILAGLGLSLISGGFGLGVGVGCLAASWLDYMSAREDCHTTYYNCANKN